MACKKEIDTKRFVLSMKAKRRKVDVDYDSCFSV